MPVLSRVQQNAVHEAAVQAGLDPLDFDWTSEQRSYVGLVETVWHRPTQSHFSFMGSLPKVQINWWPNFRDGDAHTFANSWDNALGIYVRPWMKEVKRNHDAPDLWAETAKARRLTDAAGDVGADNTPFDLAEIELLKPTLQEVEAYIQSRQPLDDGQKRVLHGRFQYLLSAAKRGIGRIDWLNIFVSQIMQLFTDGVVRSSLYGDVMRHASTAIGGAIKAVGARLLGS